MTLATDSIWLSSSVSVNSWMI